jgi:hypothetical protein
MVQYTMPFSCKRCGYECPKRIILKNHLSKKQTCAPIVADIPVNILLTELNSKITLTCSTCKQGFSKPGMLIRHQSVCTKSEPVPDLSVSLIHQLLTTLVTEMGVIRGELGVINSLLMGDIVAPLGPRSPITPSREESGVIDRGLKEPWWMPQRGR